MLLLLEWCHWHTIIWIGEVSQLLLGLVTVLVESLVMCAQLIIKVVFTPLLVLVAPLAIAIVLAAVVTVLVQALVLLLLFFNL